MFFAGNNRRQGLAIIAIILIPCFTLGYFIFYENIRTKIEDEKEKNIELAKITAQYLDTYVRSIKFSLEASSHIDKLTSRTEIAQILSSLKMRDDAESYFVLDVSGNAIVHVPKEAGNIVIPVELLEKVRSAGTIVEILNPGQDPVKLVIMAPIFDSREIIGFAGAVISMKKVARDFANIKVSNNGFVIMTDRNGQVLVHPKAALLRQKIPPEKMKDDPIYQASSKGEPGALEIVSPLDGKKKLYSYATVKETGWIVLLVEPETDLQVLVTENLTKNSVVFLLVLIAVFSLYQYLKLNFQRAAQEEAIRSEKLALVGQLAAGMAHEIRNPLTTIKGFMQMLMADEKEPKKKNHQQIIMSEVERIEVIITETLLLAKPQKEKIMEFSLEELVQQVAVVLSAETAIRNILLNINLSKEPLIITGDSNHVKQALINIVKNAIEASPEGEVVTIRTFSYEKEAVIEVTDKGSGIEAKDLHKVGTPFFTTKVTGTGLGLMVTLRIMDNMGGRLDISSTPGQGTRVQLIFPLID